MCDFSNLFEIGDVVAWIADALDVNGLGAVVDELGKLVRVIALDKLGGDAQARQEDFELVVRSAIEIGRGDDIVPGMRQGGKGHELRRLAGRRCHGRNPPFERGDAFFEDVVGRLGRRDMVTELAPMGDSRPGG